MYNWGGEEDNEAASDWLQRETMVSKGRKVDGVIMGMMERLTESGMWTLQRGLRAGRGVCLWGTLSSSASAWIPSSQRDAGLDS